MLNVCYGIADNFGENSSLGKEIFLSIWRWGIKCCTNIEVKSYVRLF